MVGSDDMLSVDAKAGSGDDQVYATTKQTLADAVAAQEVAVASGRADLLLDGGLGADSVFGAAGDDALFGGDGADTIVGGAGADVIFSDGDSGLQYPELTPQSTSGFRWVAGSNAGGSWAYFNGAPRFGTVAYGYGGSGLPSQEEQHFSGNYYSIESTDFTPLAALGTVPLGAGDYPSGWTVQADGRFYASYTPTGAFDPQAGYYFNTNRHRGSDVVFAGSIASWHVQSGAGSMTWAGSNDLADVAIGGTAGDTLNGVVGKGVDTLDGGDAGDIYVVAAYAGTDTIASSEAADRLTLDGRQLNGDGSMISDGPDLKLWMDLSNPASAITYRFDVPAKKLTVTSAGSVVAINDFVEGDVGIFIPKKPEDPRDSTSKKASINTNYRNALPAPVRLDSSASQHARSWA